MLTLNISEARNTLPALVETVATTGAPVLLLRYGKPAAMLVPVQAEAARTEPYPLRKVPITVSDDFDAPTPGLWEAAAVAEKQSRYAAAKKPAGAAKTKARKP